MSTRETFYGYDGNGYQIGDRIELSPHLDLWMRGARFGVVVGSSLTPKDRIKVELDKIPGRKYSCAEDSVRFVASHSDATFSTGPL